MIDSSAAHHVTGNAQLLSFTSPSADITVTFRYGRKLKAERVGTAHIELEDKSLLILRDVLYVPGTAANLLSVSSAARKGYAFCFSNDRCSITCGLGIYVAAARIDAHGTFSLRDHGLAAQLQPHDEPWWQRR